MQDLFSWCCFMTPLSFDVMPAFCRRCIFSRHWCHRHCRSTLSNSSSHCCLLLTISQPPPYRYCHSPIFISLGTLPLSCSSSINRFVGLLFLLFFLLPPHMLPLLPSPSSSFIVSPCFLFLLSPSSSATSPSSFFSSSLKCRYIPMHMVHRNWSICNGPTIFQNGFSTWNGDLYCCLPSQGQWKLVCTKYMQKI